jgi:hypothetical protein
MLTVPAGTPALAVTSTAMLVNEQVADSLDCVVSVVVVFTLCACDAATNSAGMASAIPTPATNSSREARRKMPLTCTCSKLQNHLPPEDAG